MKRDDEEGNVNNSITEVTVVKMVVKMEVKMEVNSLGSWK